MKKKIKQYTDVVISISITPEQKIINIKTEKIIKIVNSCETLQQFENIKKFLNESEFETVGDCKILRETLIQKQKQFNTIQDEKN